ncbi:hypothetical protein BDN72DRAFT_896200 [Pluteus cervinus]|uniref:Uncharacterized protein n=1 Tax=Pluteus cervinus TaxID=181527 RepID=A0ACD3AYI4_9AGAR|nr:hypothetical protein BDN72DRAFT_896200 [Pluteus cervinus]
MSVYLRSSPNITHLAIWGDVDVEEKWLDHLKQLSLVRLSVYPSVLRMVHADRSVESRNRVESMLSCFPQLTHLDLVTELPIPSIPCLATLPNLMYLSMCLDQIRPWHFSDLREECPALKALIFFSEEHGPELYLEGDDDHDLQYVEDPRVISCRVSDFVVDWKRGARGQEDIHDFALGKLSGRVDKIKEHVRGLELQ